MCCYTGDRQRLPSHVTMRGTHKGVFQSLALTGKRVEVRAMDMFRNSDGKIVEHWGRADDPTDFCARESAPEPPRNQLPRSSLDSGKKKGRGHVEALSPVTPSASLPALRHRRPPVPRRVGCTRRRALSYRRAA